MTDEELIRKALKLAERGRGRVSPNPLVGAIITKNNEIVAQGFHRAYGDKHAEIAAFESVSTDVRGGTLYVNLEPCSHFGKQPPCVERIVESGLKRVVVGTRDPNPLVNGRGLEYLRRHGLQVSVGVLADACRDLNAGVFKYVQTGYPLITLKIAQTLDGRIAARNGNSKWITSEKSRKLVHQMRSRHDAVLVGIGTVLKDDPGLDVRLSKGANPKRIVLDSRLRISLNSKLLTDSPEQTIVATTSKASREKMRTIRDLGATIWSIRANAQGQIALKALCKKMGKAGITSVLVEGGSKIFSAFLRSRLADRIAVFIAPKILGGGLSAINLSEIKALENGIILSDFRKQLLGNDILITGNLDSNLS